MTQITIKMYSSSVHTPVFDINASPSQAPGRLISLAYLAIRGEEHYEAV